MLKIPSGDGIILSEADKKRFASPKKKYKKRKARVCSACKADKSILFEFKYATGTRTWWLCQRCAGIIIRVKEHNAKRKIKEPRRLLTLKQAELDAIEAVELHQMSITDSAAALGITRATMYAKLKEHGIERN